LRIRLIVGLSGLILITGAAAIWLQSELSNPYYKAGQAGVFVDLPRGTGTRAIAEALKSSGVLHHTIPFILYVRWTGLARHLKAGEYSFAAPASPGEVARRLAVGDIYYHSITIPEGLTSREVINLLARNGFGDENGMLALLCRSDWISDLDPYAKGLDGYLFPDTYLFVRRETPQEILQKMVAEFRARIAKLLLADPLPARSSLGQVIILASMIEKEAKVDEERPLIASVLLNRLRLGMPLGCDATIVYALKQSDAFDGYLHKPNMSMPSPYNTYTHLGLPPGPIANPGAASIRAALAPETSEYLYYVSKNDGTHYFSKDLQSHLMAVARYQKKPSRDTGRSQQPIRRQSGKRP
jgi:UPF0755 protein